MGSVVSGQMSKELPLYIDYPGRLLLLYWVFYGTGWLYNVSC